MANASPDPDREVITGRGMGTANNPFPKSHFEAVDTEQVSNVADKIIGNSDNIQTAIDEINAGDTLLMGGGLYSIDYAPITIDKPLTIIGTKGNTYGSDYGTILEQQTTNSDLFKITTVEDEVNLFDFSILMNEEQGYGINANPPSDGSGYTKRGMRYATWKNIMVDEVHGDYYGFNIVNPLYCYIEQPTTFGGGCIRWENDLDGANNGNSVVMLPFSKISLSGSAHGFNHVATSGNQTMIVYIRPQISIDSSINSSQKHITYSDVGGEVRNINVLFSDFEGPSTAGGVELPLDENTVYIPQFESSEIPESPNIVQLGFKGGPPTDFALWDRWGDGKLMEREDRYEGRYVKTSLGPKPSYYRPRWKVLTGSPTANVGEMVLPAGDTTQQKVQMSSWNIDRGIWEMDVKYSSAPTVGDFRWRIAEADPNNTVWLRVYSSGSVEIIEDHGGTRDTLISSTVSPGTSVNTWRIEIDYQKNIELFFNGVSQGSATKYLLPGSNAMYINNMMDVEVLVKRVYVR